MSAHVTRAGRVDAGYRRASPVLREGHDAAEKQTKTYAGRHTHLLSCHDVAKLPEAVFHAFTLGLLANLRQIYEIRSNVEAGYGRADILMRPKTAAYPLGFTIEFKAIPSDADAATATAEALAQIEARDYAADLLESGVSANLIRKLAIVVAGKRVTVTLA